VRALALAALDRMVAGADDDAALQPDEAVR